MKNVFEKFKNKSFMQNLIIEIIGDLLILAAGLLIGYYFKTIMFNS